MITTIPLDLIKRGVEVFGNKEAFWDWLKKKNFFFDKKAPIELIHTDKGIKFIESRLTSMENNDNG